MSLSSVSSSPSSSLAPSANTSPQDTAPSPYQEYIDRLGAFAKSPLPAYAQASLFALVSPLGFAGGRDRARLPDKVPGERAIESLLREAKERRTGVSSSSSTASSSGSSASATSKAGSASATAAAAKASKAAKTAVNVRALPPFWQLAGFAAAFAGGGYIIDCGDVLNGSGTVTAWSLGYLFFNAGNSIRKPNVVSATLTCTAIASLAIHGSHYFSRTSWRGAVPGLANIDTVQTR